MKLKIEKNKKLIIVECLIIVIFVALIIVSASKFKTGKNGEILNEPQENSRLQKVFKQIEKGVI